MKKSTDPKGALKNCFKLSILPAIIAFAPQNALASFDDKALQPEASVHVTESPSAEWKNVAMALDEIHAPPTLDETTKKDPTERRRSSFVEKKRKKRPDFFEPYPNWRRKKGARPKAQTQ